MTKAEVGEMARVIALQYFAMGNWPDERKREYFADLVERLERFPNDVGTIGIAKAIQERRWKYPPSPADVEFAIADYADAAYLRWQCLTKTLKRDGSGLPGAAWFATLPPGEAGKIINGGRWGK